MLPTWKNWPLLPWMKSWPRRAKSPIAKGKNQDGHRNSDARAVAHDGEGTLAKWLKKEGIR